MKILLEPILICLLVGAIVLAMPRVVKKFTGFFSIIVSLYVFLLCIKIFLKSPVNIGMLYVDYLSRFIVLGIGFFGFLITLYSLRFMDSYKEISLYYTYILWTIGFSILAAVSNNIIMLIIAWGFLGFTLYMLINIAGPEAAAISKKSFIIIGASDGLMILGFGIVWVVTNTLNLSDMKIIIHTPIHFWAFWLIAIAAFAKAGVMPFHTWIPETAQKAPIPVTAFLVASIDKLLGIYLLARLMLNIFTLNAFSYTLLMLIGAFTIICAVMMVLVQNDFKKLLGYCTVSQVGYMVLGFGTGNPIGIAAGLFHMINHSLYECCLFLSGGNVEYKTKTSKLDNLGGFSKLMPLTFFTSLVGAFSISGIPPFNGFFSKWMIYQGLADKAKSGSVLWILCIVLAMFGSGLTLAALVKFIHAIFLGMPKKRQKIFSGKDEVCFSMWFPPMMLAVLCVVFGIFAYKIPLRYMIVPAISSELTFIGIWPSIKATVLLVTGLGIGVVVYLLGNIKGIRESDSYIGGELVQEEMKVSGTEFYNTVREFGVLNCIYKKAESGFFDIYEHIKNSIFGVGRILQYLHNGVLPTYLVWTLLGMMVLFLVMLK